MGTCFLTFFTMSRSHELFGSHPTVFHVSLKIKFGAEEEKW